MLKQIHYLALFALGFIVLSSLVTMMIVFTGGRLHGADVAVLLYTQLVSVPIAIGILAIEVGAFVRLNGWRRGLLAALGKSACLAGPRVRARQLARPGR